MRGTFPQAFPSPFPSCISFMKKFFVVFISLIIAFSCVVIPASAADYQIQIAYNEFNVKRFEFYVSTGNHWATLSGGPFWSTSVAPGFMVYNSGALSTLFDNQRVELTGPGLQFDDTRPKFYINKNEPLIISGKIILYSKTKGHYTDLHFDGSFIDSKGNLIPFESSYFYITKSTYYPTDTTQIYVDFEVTVSTAGLPEDSCLSSFSPVLHIDNIGEVSSLESTAVGIGFFNPGLTVRNGSQENAPIYKSPDRTALDKENQLTAQIENQTSQGVNETENMFDNFDSLFGQSGHLYKGLVSVSNMVSTWLGIEFLSPVVSFSLTMGIFAFLLGSAIALGYSIKASRVRVNKENYSKRTG